MRVRILEVNQWVSTGNITDFTFDNFDPVLVKGDDARVSLLLFGEKAIVKEVDRDDAPSIGYVWFDENPVTKKLRYYKSNYDSSD